jgi:hypothetical protein
MECFVDQNTWIRKYPFPAQIFHLGSVCEILLTLRKGALLDSVTVSCETWYRLEGWWTLLTAPTSFALTQAERNSRKFVTHRAFTAR